MFISKLINIFSIYANKNKNIIVIARKYFERNYKGGFLLIRKAVKADVDRVNAVYEELLCYEERHGAYTVWKSGVYPTKNIIEQAIQAGVLYVLEENDSIVASVLLDQIQPEAYQQICWSCSVKPKEIMVIHLLCVRPSKARCGYGKRMIQFAIGEAAQRGCKTVRLDTGVQNIPATSLYTKMGFRLVGVSPIAIGEIIPCNNHLFLEYVL